MEEFYEAYTLVISIRILSVLDYHTYSIDRLYMNQNKHYSLSVLMFPSFVIGVYNMAALKIFCST